MKKCALALTLILLVGACTRATEETVVETTLPPTQPTASTEPPISFGPGVDEGLIRVGALLPLTGPRGSLGESVLRGHEAYWTYVNQELGGIEGFEVQVVAADSQYLPDVAEVEAARLAEETLTISSSLGSPITDAALPVAAQQGLLLAAGAQVSAWGSDPSLLLDLAFPSYRDQVRVGLAWAATTEELTQGGVAGIVAQAGVYGDDCVEGFSRGVAETGLDEGPVLRHDLAQTEFTDTVEGARDNAVDLLIICSVPDTLLSIAGTAELIGYTPLIVATAVSYDAGIPAALGGDAGEESGLDLLSRVFVMGALEERDDTSPGLRLYDDNLARAGLEANEESWYTYLGYTQAATTHVILAEALVARDVTREGLRAAVAALNPVDFGFGAGPMSFEEDGAPSAVDAVGRPVLSGDALFGLQRIQDFIRLEP